MKSMVSFLLAACLAACSLPGPSEPDRYFVLDAGSAPGAATRSGTSPAVAPTSAAGFYDTQDIVYSREPGTRAYYQFNHWTERPQRSIHAQLASRLDGGDPKSGLRLNTHLEEIYHDAAEQPGTARIRITAELADPVRQVVLARRIFTQSAPVPSYDAPGAVRAFNQALATLLDEIGKWVEAETRSRPAQ